MSGLTMEHVGAFGPLGRLGLGDARSSSETFEWSAERWKADGCTRRGAAYLQEPPGSGCHFHANLAINASQQMALVRLGIKGHSVADVEQAIMAGRSLGGFSPAQLSYALSAGQNSAMRTLGIPVPPKAVPQPPRPGSLEEGLLLQSLATKIAELAMARGVTPPPSPVSLTPEQQAIIARMTAQEQEAARRAGALAAVRAAQAQQDRLRRAQAGLPPPMFGPSALSIGPVEPWKATGILLIGAAVVGTIIYSFRRSR